jgi:hypothetical protein
MDLQTANLWGGASSQLLIENPINRYLINSPMLPDMKKNAARFQASPGAPRNSSCI